MISRRILFCLLLVFAPTVHAEAQAPATARLSVTVLDPGNAPVPGATVSLIGIETVTKKTVIAPVTSGDKGLATFDNLAVGRYSIQATFQGFDDGLLRDITVRRGDNKHVIVLVLKGVSETVTVGGGQEETSSRNGTSFGVSLSQEAIDTLSDNPDELMQQLQDLAGPNAVIRVDSFEGADLPPKSQIKSVHITRDQFAAEADYPGSTFVDIVTQPGSGPIGGNINAQYRPTNLAGASPFVAVRQPESNRQYNGTVGGTIVPNTSDFSLSLRGQDSFTTPILNQAGSTAQILSQRQTQTFVDGTGLLNYALTPDQSLRVSYRAARQHMRNQGIGQYDSAERAYGTDFKGFQLRVQEAGPVGRRIFQNTRLLVQGTDQEQHSVLNAPTIVIQDSRTTGGAQMTGGVRNWQANFNSDVDYIRGIHSWRAGVQVNAQWYDSDSSSNALGTYTFADQASFAAGRPLLYTQSIGNPRVRYFNAQTAAYLQDDLRISKSLTLSPGVRYMVQTHVHDWTGLAPRFGLTWSPFKSGHTSFRASAGLFYWPMEMARVYEQTLRFDGHHQQQVVIVNPTYPDPGPVAGVPPNVYELGTFSLQRNVRYSAGVEHAFSPHIRASVLYAYWHQFQFWTVQDLNEPVNGVRPDPAFANVLQASTEGQIRRHDVTVNLNINLASGPAANQGRFNWRRISMTATYGVVRAWATGDGPWTPSPTGTLATEWAPWTEDQPYRITAQVTSTQLRNLNVNLSWTGTAGDRYTLITGTDTNGDGILNDRPIGTPLRSLQAAAQSTLNLRASYTLSTSPTQGPAGAAGRRYRVGLTFSATNLTNRANYGGYSGNMVSPNFEQPTLVVNPRRADVGLNIGF